MIRIAGFIALVLTVGCGPGLAGDGDGDSDTGDGDTGDGDTDDAGDGDGDTGLDTCPFEMQVGPTLIAGATPYGVMEYTVGAFGLVHGEGPAILSIVLAPDLVLLGNHLWSAADPPASTDVLTLWGGNPMPGEYEIYVQTAVPLSRGTMGTLTITNIVSQGDFVDHELWATLGVDGGEWKLYGEFAIPGCQWLEQHLP
jgi:hypothetical protein